MSPDDPRHGTDRGYQAHYRINETPCDDCSEAHKRYTREHRAPTSQAIQSLASKAVRQDVDEVVIQRHLDGQPCPANHAERLEIVQEWSGRGLSMTQLQELVHWNVNRYQRALRALGDERAVA